MKLVRRIILLIVIVATDLLFVYVMNFSLDSDVNTILTNHTKSTNQKVESAINTHNLLGKSMLIEISDKGEVLKIFSRAHDAVNPEKKLIREEMYEALLHIYGNFRNVGIDQLHFHLPNNESFLRFNRPGKYGDDLSDVRYSVKQANIHKTEFSGFEEGPFFNGFRVLCPLEYNGKHIGTAEAGFSFGSVRNLLYDQGVSNAAFMVRKGVVGHKVISSTSESYEEAVVSDKFFMVKEFCHYENDSADVLRYIDSMLREKVKARLQASELFSECCIAGGDYYVVSFVPVQNIEKESAAYIVSYVNDEVLKALSQRYNYIIYIGVFLFPVIIILIYSFVINNTRIRTKNMLLNKSERALRKKNRKLEKRTLELNETIAVKNKTFSILAHDLINPFGAIREMSALMISDCREKKYDRIEKFSELIYKSSSQSAELLVNMLNWSRVQTGRMKFRPENTNLLIMADSAVHLLSSNIEKKELFLKNEIPDNLIVFADRDMVETVFRNLISNAIKFTPVCGLISVSCEVKNSEVVVCVKDSGVGIKEENFDKVFNVGDDLTTLGTEDEKGTGLGLILCKEFVEKNGGVIWFESEEEKGTAFYFTIPVAQ